MFFILPYKAYTPYCRSPFYVNVIVQPQADGSCLNENIKVGVYPEAQETRWADDIGQVLLCTKLSQSIGLNYCEHLYICECEQFCTIMISVYEITQPAVNICEIIVY